MVTEKQKLLILTEEEGRAFNPASLGLRVWYDGSDYSSMTDDGAGLISQLRDKSGNNNHANALLTGRPTYTPNLKKSLGGLVSNGNSFMTLTSTLLLTGAYTTIYVLQVTSGSINEDRRWFGNVDATQAGYNGSGDPDYFISRISDAGGIVTTRQIWALGSNAGVVIEKRTSAGLYQVSQNGVAFSSNATDTGTRTINTVAGKTVTQRFRGNSFEIMVVDRELTNTEITQVLNYLNNKWALY